MSAEEAAQDSAAEPIAIMETVIDDSSPQLIAHVSELLLDAGAIIDAKDAHGESPLSWASWHLRPGSILGMLCYGPFRIHPDRRRQTTCEPATGSMDAALLGNPHLPSLDVEGA